jgi:hypothetical protein
MRESSPLQAKKDSRRKGDRVAEQIVAKVFKALV